MTPDLPFSLKARFLRAVLFAAITGGWFLLVYGQCNAQAQRLAESGVLLPTVAFEWERHIPIIPAFIIPYMSIDLFFVASPLLCRTRREMNRHAVRLLTAITVAGVFFWFVPLRYAFPRPQVSGLFGPIFDFLHGFDQPYNLAPSLHIGLRSLLWVIYVRHTTGRLRTLVKIWFIAIGVSTLLVGQHHIVDVVTGQLLAMWCLHLIPDGEIAPLASNTNVRVGLYYLSGVVVFAVAAAFLGVWGLVLAWPAYALAIVAVGYLGAGPFVFRKIDGTLTHSAQVILAPYLAGAWLNWRLTRSSRAIAEVTPTLLVGRKLSPGECRILDDCRVSHVIDLTAEFSSPRMSERDYVCVPVLDLVVPSAEQLRAISRYYVERRSTGRVLVACALGYSRSVCAAAACLLASGEADSVDDAVNRVRNARGRVVLSARHLAVLQIIRDERSNA